MKKFRGAIKSSDNEEPSSSVALTHSSKYVNVNPSLKGIKYVIFPENKFAQIWDFIIILAIWYYAFYIPFHFGISGGYYTVYYTWFLVVNMIVNFTFILDTFLAFFRAYRDKNGKLVYSLKSIRREYIRSGWLFINLLASLPASSWLYAEARQSMEAGDATPLEDPNLRLYFMFELFKLLRMLRLKKIMMSSEVMRRFWEHVPVELALAIKFVITITLLSHWIACIWGLIAYLEAGTFGDGLGTSINWISNWYDSSYVEGGLNPIGWNNPIPRYFLCLFWSIQSITSIGYGNIAPVTTAEYGLANGLMLVCGIFWAYIIGALVDVVRSAGSINAEYVERMHEANEMMADFTCEELPQAVTGTGKSAFVLLYCVYVCGYEVSGLSYPFVYTNSNKRVRRFITHQRDRATKKWLDPNNQSTLTESYPTLSILSPELQRVCALHLTHSLLETIPYLSTKYLSPEEQAKVAMECISLEFTAGEKFREHSELGRGVLIFRQGFGVSSRNSKRKSVVLRRDLRDKPIDVDDVLVDDDYQKKHHLVYHFVGYTKVLFVPRLAIMDVFANNERAWKECTRWRYFMAMFVLYSLKDSEKSVDDCI